MRRLALLVVAGLAAGLVAACGSDASALSAHPWQLVAYASKVPVYAGVVPEAERGLYTLTFATDGSLGGQADCNLFAGKYRTSGRDALTIEIGPSTLVACPDGSLGAIYVHALGNAASWVISGGQLTITTEAGSNLEFEAKQETEGSPSAATPEPTASSTPSPSPSPSPKPTASPSPKPTAAPTASPTSQPTSGPTTKPTAAPTAKPTPAPTAKPTAAPTPAPTPPPPGLTDGTWQLTGLTLTDPPFQGALPPAQQTSYTITFANNGTFSARADCNTVTGTYTTSGSNGLTLTLGPSTIVACPEGSYSDLYVLGLSLVSSYAINNDQLVLTTSDGGTLQHRLP